MNTLSENQAILQSKVHGGCSCGPGAQDRFLLSCSFWRAAGSGFHAAGNFSALYNGRAAADLRTAAFG